MGTHGHVEPQGLRNLATGDRTYVGRVERFEYIQRRRAETPQPTIQAIADELGISKQNVSRLIKRR